MLDNNKIELCKYRLQKSIECLNSAKLLSTSNDYTASANRSYYAIFHSMRAVMALDGEDRKKHSGVVAYFQENYIKTGIFDKSYSYIIKNAFQIRQESDYEDFFIISKKEVILQIQNPEDLINSIQKYINDIIQPTA